MIPDRDEVVVYDDFVPFEIQEKLSQMIQEPIWRYGWRSNKRQDRYCFWHAHFAGGDGGSRRNCEADLLTNSSAGPVIELWKFLSGNLLKGHEPLRVYANSHTFGVEGYVHTDNTDEENYFTTIYYAHPVWRRNWSGETLFFSKSSDEIIRAVFPKPGRLVSFHGATPHMAHAPSRECPELRVSVVIKTQIADEAS
jgi:SM-20-related protein